MLKNLVCAALLAAAIAPAAALACDGEDHAQMAQKDPIENLSVEQLAKKIDTAKKSKATVAIFDANTDKTREEKGVIPTAVLLPSSSEYDLALLPKNKADDVVFYCASEKCGASHQAAKRAVDAGYTHVAVLPAGIAGWVKAGQPTQKVAAQKPAEAPKASAPAQG